jgi:hypothetical protein
MPKFVIFGGDKKWEKLFGKFCQNMYQNAESSLVNCITHAILKIAPSVPIKKGLSSENKSTRK